MEELYNNWKLKNSEKIKDFLIKNKFSIPKENTKEFELLSSIPNVQEPFVISPSLFQRLPEYIKNVYELTNYFEGKGFYSPKKYCSPHWGKFIYETLKETSNIEAQTVRETPRPIPFVHKSRREKVHEKPIRYEIPEFSLNEKASEFYEELIKKKNALKNKEIRTDVENHLKTKTQDIEKLNEDLKSINRHLKRLPHSRSKDRMFQLLNLILSEREIPIQSDLDMNVYFEVKTKSLLMTEFFTLLRNETEFKTDSPIQYDKNNPVDTSIFEHALQFVLSAVGMFSVEEFLIPLQKPPKWSDLNEVEWKKHLEILLSKTPQKMWGMIKPKFISYCKIHLGKLNRYEDMKSFQELIPIIDKYIEYIIKIASHVEKEQYSLKENISMKIGAEFTGLFSSALASILILFIFNIMSNFWFEHGSETDVSIFSKSAKVEKKGEHFEIKTSYYQNGLDDINRRGLKTSGMLSSQDIPFQFIGKQKLYKISQDIRKMQIYFETVGYATDLELGNFNKEGKIDELTDVGKFVNNFEDLVRILQLSAITLETKGAYVDIIASDPRDLRLINNLQNIMSTMVVISDSGTDVQMETKNMSAKTEKLGKNQSEIISEDFKELLKEFGIEIEDEHAKDFLSEVSKEMNQFRMEYDAKLNLIFSENVTTEEERELLIQKNVDNLIHLMIKYSVKTSIKEVNLTKGVWSNILKYLGSERWISIDSSIDYMAYRIRNLVGSVSTPLSFLATSFFYLMTFPFKLFSINLRKTSDLIIDLASRFTVFEGVFPKSITPSYIYRSSLISSSVSFLINTILSKTTLSILQTTTRQSDFPLISKISKWITPSLSFIFQLNQYMIFTHATYEIYNIFNINGMATYGFGMTTLMLSIPHITAAFSLGKYILNLWFSKSSDVKRIERTFKGGIFESLFEYIYPDYSWIYMDYFVNLREMYYGMKNEISNELKKDVLQGQRAFIIDLFNFIGDEYPQRKALFEENVIGITGEPDQKRKFYQTQLFYKEILAMGDISSVTREKAFDFCFKIFNFLSAIQLSIDRDPENKNIVTEEYMDYLFLFMISDFLYEARVVPVKLIDFDISRLLITFNQNGTTIYLGQFLKIIKDVTHSISILEILHDKVKDSMEFRKRGFFLRKAIEWTTPEVIDKSKELNIRFNFERPMLEFQEGISEFGSITQERFKEKGITGMWKKKLVSISFASMILLAGASNFIFDFHLSHVQNQYEQVVSEAVLELHKSGYFRTNLGRYEAVLYKETPTFWNFLESFRSTDPAHIQETFFNFIEGFQRIEGENFVEVSGIRISPQESYFVQKSGNVPTEITNIVYVNSDVIDAIRVYYLISRSEDPTFAKMIQELGEKIPLIRTEKPTYFQMLVNVFSRDESTLRLRSSILERDVVIQRNLGEIMKAFQENNINTISQMEAFFETRGNRFFTTCLRTNLETGETSSDQACNLINLAERFFNTE